jgi:hypothetical protein
MLEIKYLGDIDFEAWRNTALARPCRLAGETTHPRFRHDVLGYRAVLTINYGYE